jgi:glycosyltransferase involved in cell wall biosynthesis
MHVIHVYKDVYPPIVGGIEKQIDLIRRLLPDVRSDVLVCARRPRGEVRRQYRAIEVLVPELGPRVWSVPLAPTYPRALRRLDADLVHLHMPHPLGELSVLFDRRRPVVCTYHADIVRQARVAPAYRHLLNACFERAVEITVGSRRLAETSPFLGPYASRVSVLPHLVDTDQYTAAAVNLEDVARLRDRYGSRIVLAVGRLVYYKGFEVLIEAARALSASVVIIGDGPLSNHLRDLSRSLENVHLVGSVTETQLRSHLGAADCFVLPSTSRAESFGVAVLEAQAMGVPAVVTDVGTGTVEAIAPGQTGLVVPPRDPVSLAAAINEILEDPGRRRAMGQKARERVLARHSAARASERLREIYERAIVPAAGRAHLRAPR